MLLNEDGTLNVGKKLKNPRELTRKNGRAWYNHYYQYLVSLTYQLFEWENLPDSIDPRFLEISLHRYGFCGFYKDENLGYIVTNGAYSGELDIYWNPIKFNAIAPRYKKTWDVFSYADMPKVIKNVSTGEEIEKDYGVVIYNNDFRFPTVPSLKIFAEDLADLKEIKIINQRAQKTPVTLNANDNNIMSIKKIYQEYEGYAPVLINHESLQGSPIEVLNTKAPYVLDKLGIERKDVWNEVMTFLGIKNANIDKKERMITDEVEANNEQIDSSINIYLKERKEACKRINKLYGLNINVKVRDDVVDEFKTLAGKDGEDNGNSNDNVENVH